MSDTFVFDFDTFVADSFFCGAMAISTSYISRSFHQVSLRDGATDEATTANILTQSKPLICIIQNLVFIVYGY